MEINDRDCLYKDKEITRQTTCSCFKQRQSILAIEPICWFCRYARYDLESNKLPQTGICKYPTEQTK
jgi:hypothetical protein